MSEIDLGVQHFCDVLVFSELSSVVGGDGKDMTLERPEQLDYDLGHSLCPSWQAVPPVVEQGLNRGRVFRSYLNVKPVPCSNPPLWENPFYQLRKTVGGGYCDERGLFAIIRLCAFIPDA